MSRPTWDETAMNIVDVIARRSACSRRSVGAVLMTHAHRLIATGYNGPPRGLAHASEVGCLREQLGVPSGERHELCRGLHAEQNALLQCAIHGVSPIGSTLYCTNKPCSTCAKMLIQAGIVRVVYRDDYNDTLADSLFAEGGVLLGKV